MSVVNYSELINGIKSIKGCVFAHIEYYSEVKIPKKYGIIGNVKKFVSGSVQLNYSYENAVNNRLEQNGNGRDFVSQPLKWGAWLIQNKIIEHKDKYYLRFYNYSGAPKEISYFVDNRPITEEELAKVKEYEKSKYKPSKTQTDKGLTEHQVTLGNVEFSNLVCLKCGSIEYQQISRQAV